MWIYLVLQGHFELNYVLISTLLSHSDLVTIRDSLGPFGAIWTPIGDIENILGLFFGNLGQFGFV